MRFTKLSLTAGLMTGALLCGGAQAVPKGAITSHIVCQLTTKDATGKVVGSRRLERTTTSPLFKRSQGDKDEMVCSFFSCSKGTPFGNL